MGFWTRLSGSRAEISPPPIPTVVKTSDENEGSSSTISQRTRNQTKNEPPTTPWRNRNLRDDVRREQQRSRSLRDIEHNLKNMNEELRRGNAVLESKIERLESTNWQLKKDSATAQKEKETFEKYHGMVASHLNSYARMRGLHYTAKDFQATNTILQSMSKDARHSVYEAQEIPALQAQINMLQEQLLRRIDKTDAMSDDQLAQEFRSLSSSVRTLSRLARDPKAMNILEVTEDLPLCREVSEQHWQVSSHQKYFFEAFIWSALIMMVFQSPFAIFENQSSTLYAVWEQIFGSEHAHGWPLPSEQSEKWRIITAGRLVEDAGREFIVAGSDEIFLTGLKQQIAHTKTVVRVFIAEYLCIEIHASQVEKLVDKAFGLAMQMSLQRCRLQVTFPAVGSEFWASEMSALPGDDGEEMRDGTVAFISTPGLTKWGDATGNKLGCRYDIVSALVKLERRSVSREQVLTNAPYSEVVCERSSTGDTDKVFEDDTSPTVVKTEEDCGLSQTQNETRQ